MRTAPALPGVGVDLVIAHVVPAGVHPYSGLLTAVLQLAMAQTRRGHEVELWVLGPSRPATKELYAAAESAGVACVAFRTSRIPGRLSAEAARAVTARVVDIVHLHGVFSPNNNEVARRLRVPYVLSPHGGYSVEALEYHSLRKRVFAWLFERSMLRRARVVCALTVAEAAEVRRFGVTGAVAVVPNGVARLPNEVLDRVSLRTRLGWPPESRLAVYAGRLDVRAKRLDEVLRGIAGSPEWRLNLIGGDYRNGARDLEGLIKKLGLEDRVRITAPKRGRALHDELACADLFVLLSRSEGLPIALLEAASLGIPALVSPEVERSTGVAAAGAAWVTTLAQLTATFQTVARADPDEWALRRTAAMEYTRTHDWSSVAAAYDAVYHTAVSSDATTGDGLSGASSIIHPV